MTKFKVGDVVQLASGGPYMTVVGDGDAKGYISCCWFASNVAPSYAPFLEGVLIKIDLSVIADHS